MQGKVIKGRQIKLELGIKKDRSEDLKAKKRKLYQTTAEGAQVAIENENTENLKQKPKVDVSAKTKVENSSISEAEVIESEGIIESTEASIKKSRQILVFGIPIDVTKKIFKRVLDKASRKTTVELVKEDHELSDSLHLVHPPGKVS